MVDAKEGDTGRLVEFLRNRDAPCPQCGYNLRDLNQPRCPECHQDLVLTVGVTRPRFLWFLLAVTPFTFSAIAALLLLIPIVGSMLAGAGPPPPVILALDGFGWLSGLTGVLFIRHRFAFLRQKADWQRHCAIGVWVTHALAFFGFIAAAIVWG
ncbi:MAG: hypothetical protein ACYTGP_10435 [Planctomycetota bacterium]|jgi:hypothetical protein